MQKGCCMSGVVGVFAVVGARVPCDPLMVEMAKSIASKTEIPMEFNDHRLQLKAVVNPRFNQSTYHCTETGCLIWLQGQFDNQEVLSARVGAQGARVYNQAELLLRLYQSRGLLSVPMLKGQFSAFIWDPQEQRFILFRDPLGYYPLFIRHDGDHVWFSSHESALHVESPRLDIAALHRMIMTGDVGPKQTLLQKIESVGAGEIVTIEKGRMRRSRYWRFLWEESYQEPSIAQMQEMIGASVDKVLEKAEKETLTIANPVEATPLLPALVNTQSRKPINALPYERDGLDYIEMVKAWGRPITSLESLPWIASIFTAEPDQHVAMSVGEDILFGFHHFTQKQRWLQRLPLATHEVDESWNLPALQPLYHEYQATKDYFSDEINALFSRDDLVEDTPLEWQDWSPKEQLHAKLFEHYLQPLMANLNQIGLKQEVQVHMPFADMAVIEWLSAQHPRFHTKGVVGGQLLDQAYHEFFMELDVENPSAVLRNAYQHEQLWLQLWPQCCAALQDTIKLMPFNKDKVFTLMDRVAVSRGKVSTSDQRALIFLSSFALWYESAFES